MFLFDVLKYSFPIIFLFMLLLLCCFYFPFLSCFHYFTQTFLSVTQIFNKGLIYILFKVLWYSYTSDFKVLVLQLYFFSQGSDGGILFWLFISVCIFSLETRHLNDNWLFLHVHVNFVFVGWIFHSLVALSVSDSQANLMIVHSLVGHTFSVPGVVERNGNGLGEKLRRDVEKN